MRSLTPNTLLHLYPLISLKLISSSLTINLNTTPSLSLLLKPSACNTRQPPSPPLLPSHLHHQNNHHHLLFNLLYHTRLNNHSPPSFIATPPSTTHHHHSYHPQINISTSQGKKREHHARVDSVTSQTRDQSFCFGL